jgi:hypothetical protein
MSSFKLRIEERALEDIQKGFDFYEERQVGLGVRFNKHVFKCFEILKSNPHYQIRYGSFRCLPMKKFPFMIHYELDEDRKMVNIFAVINTHLNPNENWLLDQ